MTRRTARRNGAGGIRQDVTESAEHVTNSITRDFGLPPDLVVLDRAAIQGNRMRIFSRNRSDHKRRTLSRQRPGFTLAEMMVVVVITGLMVVLAIPRIDTTKFKADAIATIVRTTLQTAQRQAITRQHDMVVSFDTTGERIRTFWDQNNDGTIATGTNAERVTWRGLDVGILFTDPAALREQLRQLDLL